MCWLFLGLFALLVLVFRLPMFAFRQSEEAQRTELVNNGQTAPISFHTYEVKQADGTPRNMHYTHVGETHLPLVVLLHGAPGSSNAMNAYLADTSLTKVAQVVAVDRPGYGFSDYGNTERSLAAQAAALKPILEYYRTGKTILLGHSFGGPVIARMAMDYPDLVEGLVVVAGSVAPELEPEEWWRKPLDWAILRWILPASFRVCNQEILPLKSELEAMLPLWEKVTCPVVVYQGEADSLVPKGNADFIEQMLPNNPSVMLHMVEEGKHFILWSMQAEIVETLKQMLLN